MDIAKVAGTVRDHNRGGPWFDEYNQQVADKTGFRLERLPKSVCPPRNPNQIWIAGIHMPDDHAAHVVVARGCYVVHDPLGEFAGLVPLDRCWTGCSSMREQRRVVPVFSPYRHGNAIVAA